MADNKAASVILVCVKCRRKISGLTRALRNQRCACGGEMVEDKPAAKEPKA